MELQGNAHLSIQASKKLYIHGSRTDVANDVFSEVLAIGPYATLTLEDHAQLWFQASGAINLEGLLEIDCAGDCTSEYPTIWLRGDNVPVVITTFGGGYMKSRTGARCVIIGNTPSDVFCLGQGNEMQGRFDIPITFVAAGNARTKVDPQAEAGNTINLYCYPKIINYPGEWTVDGGASGSGNEAKIVVNTMVSGTAKFKVDDYGLLAINRHFTLMQKEDGTFSVHQPLGKLKVLKATSSR